MEKSKISQIEDLIKSQVGGLSADVSVPHNVIIEARKELYKNPLPTEEQIKNAQEKADNKGS